MPRSKSYVDNGNYHLVVRIYIGEAAQTFKEIVEVPLREFPPYLRKMFEQHKALLATAAAPHMIEIENLDMPMDERFIRFGPDPSGMVVPFLGGKL